VTATATRIAGLSRPERCPRLNGAPAKRCYGSPAKARRAVRLILSAGGPRLHAYECVRCRYWHLSHEQPRDATR
jgi:hypothetical protein